MNDDYIRGFLDALIGAEMLESYVEEVELTCTMKDGTIIKVNDSGVWKNNELIMSK